MTKKELLYNIAKASAANGSSAEVYLRNTNIAPRDVVLEDLIAAAYYAGRASMAANIHDTETGSNDLTKIAMAIYHKIEKQINYFR